MTNSVYYRLCAGGTRPDNVVNLIDALTALLNDTRAGQSNPLFSSSDGSSQVARPVLVPIAPDLDPDKALEILKNRVKEPVSPTVDVILQTSGSTTGRGHLVGLSIRALRASAYATLSALGGPGRWILALPTHHVAGFQVLTRSIIADIRPVIMDTTKGFKVDGLVRAVNRAIKMEDKRAKEEADNPDYRRYPIYISLVPTQLKKVLDDPAATEALAKVDKVLVGGAHSADTMLQAAEEAGITVVTTYGMTETCGGCVYNGMPLSGVQVATIDNLVWLSGTTLMETYVDDPDSANFVIEGLRRWYKTSDAGHMEGPRLVVDGRIDDVINTGGVKIQASLVEEVLNDMPEVDESCVVGVPDPRWGHIVTAVFVPSKDVDEELLAPLAELCDLPRQSDKPREEPPADNAIDQAEIDYATLTPLEAAMAAMAAKIRGEDVDVVEAAKTGKLPENIYQISQQDDEVANPTVAQAPKDALAAQQRALFGEVLDDKSDDTAQDEPAGDDDDDATIDRDHIDENTLAVYMRGRVSRELDRAHAPRAIVVTDYLPLLASGKVDRHEVRRLATVAVHERKAWLR